MIKFCPTAEATMKLRRLDPKGRVKRTFTLDTSNAFFMVYSKELGILVIARKKEAVAVNTGRPEYDVMKIRTNGNIETLIETTDDQPKAIYIDREENLVVLSLSQNEITSLKVYSCDGKKMLNHINVIKSPIDQPSAVVQV